MHLCRCVLERDSEWILSSPELCAQHKLSAATSATFLASYQFYFLFEQQMLNTELFILGISAKMLFTMTSA